jgi:hypothetical protein
LRSMLLMAAGILGSYLFISSMAINGKWGLWYYGDFMKHFTISYEVKESFSFSDYFALAYSKLITGIVFSSFTIFILMSLMIVYDGIRARKLNFDQFFILLLAVVLAARFVVFPDISDRFYVAYYLVIAMIFMRKFTPFLQARR